MAWFWEKKSAPEQSTRPERQILNSLLISSADAIIFYDTDFKILLFNKSAERLFNLPAEKIVGQPFSLAEARQSSSKLLASVMFPSLAPTVVRQSPEGVYPQVIDLLLENPQVELRITLDRVVDSQGRTVGFVKIIHDQTREKELMDTQKDFVTVAAHQLRTPATAINWAFENLDEDKAISQEAKEMINIGHAAANNLMKIINDLLNIAQIEEGHFGFQFQEIDLGQFLDKLLAEAEPVAKEYKVNVYLDRPPKVIQVKADTVKLGLAISNLIDNAIKYNIPNGQVTVKLSEVGEQGKPFAQVSVNDTGAGIPEGEMDKLFGKFFRASNVDRLAVAGSGLGLYIAKNVIEQHGGRIWGESILGRGTTFYFTLPIANG